MFTRPITQADLRELAQTLKGTDEDLWIALSEQGFDPNAYNEDELRQWLYEETGIYQEEDSYMWLEDV